MSRRIGCLVVAIALTACATTPPANFEKRPLTMQEKEALQKSLAQALKDPAAKFKWMPVIVSRGEESVGYCALVYGKNSYGGYIGYRTFFAMLTPNARGEYTGGTITYMGGRPTTLGNDTADDAVANGLIEGSCNRWGYTDFTEAT